MNREIITKAIHHGQQVMPAPTRQEFLRMQSLKGSNIAEIMDETDPLNLIGKRSLLERIKRKFSN